MDGTIQALMREATQLTQAGRVGEATETIQRALSGIAPSESLRRFSAHATGLQDRSAFLSRPALRPMRDESPYVDEERGEFTSGMHTHGATTRAYKLYVPPGDVGPRPALIVMLHGCTQDPDDFAAGTGLNERAREGAFFVLYPAQSQDANPSRCWNWFKPNHQRRGRGEAGLIADMTQAIVNEHGIDPERVFIAGLSAGGAMAAVVAAGYPEIFAAVGVHSGLPPGIAENLPEALAAMKGDAAPGARVAGITRVGRMPGGAPVHTPVPTIVFHGDQDGTVHPRNAGLVVEAMLGGSITATRQGSPHSVRNSRVEYGMSVHGRRYTRTIYVGDDGEAVAEHWVIHGAGHAWAGGRPQGSYTDAQGPDATSEMLRFFFSHSRNLERRQ
jgi:poly(hydroxyalkanoate) depolymerase family esterase